MLNLLKILFIVLIIYLPANANEKLSGYDIRFGAGFTSLGTDDMGMDSEEIEINSTVNKHWAGSLSIAFGRNRPKETSIGKYVQGNFSIFFSPFDNEGTWDGRIGFGLTYWDLNYTFYSYSWVTGQPQEKQAHPGSSNALGYNIIVENSWMVTNRVLLGFKVYLQQYFDDHNHLGLLMFKFGIKI